MIKTSKFLPAPADDIYIKAAQHEAMSYRNQFTQLLGYYLPEFATRSHNVREAKLAASCNHVEISTMSKITMPNVPEVNIPQESDAALETRINKIIQQNFKTMLTKGNPWVRELETTISTKLQRTLLHEVMAMITGARGSHTIEQHYGISGIAAAFGQTVGKLVRKLF